ncbi:MAG: alpha-1,2-fucosyltransferase [Lachnospiraceae bacterium]|jgi:hypothetical protein|nr:alpha-1,2-fucosyltransferase [Lachnospiraceae bacterium]
MIVVHIESGLGNQMLGYLEYLAIKQENPDEECYIETIVYELGEKQNVINMWNGYELESVFGIKAPNIRDIIDENIWDRIISHVEKSEFWNHNWSYPEAITKAFAEEGYWLENRCKSYGSPIRNKEKNIKSQMKIFGKNCFNGKPFAYYCKLKETVQFYSNDRRMDHSKDLFPNHLNNVYCGFTLNFSKTGYGIEKLELDPVKIFRFPELQKKENIEMAKKLRTGNSVAIHARRGDLLTFNGVFYKNGYFKQATKIIRKNILNPEFYFFSDPGSVDWCKKNLDIFGLDCKKDVIHFIDWNKGNENYRDMQLMTMCKANIITNSSFGWWGAYLNCNPHKITVSPGHRILTTHHC